MKIGENFKKCNKAHNQDHKSKVEDFKSILDYLLDIAHQDALKNINEEDRQFLLLQRQKGRLGCTVGGVDVKIFRDKERSTQR